jgi:hypothetical protein
LTARTRAASRRRRIFNLAPSLLEKDRWGNWVINEAYNPTMLSEALQFAVN